MQQKTARSKPFLTLLKGGKEKEKSPEIRLEYVAMDILETFFPEWIEEGKAAVCIRALSADELRHLGKFGDGLPERMIAASLTAVETREQVWNLSEAHQLSQMEPQAKVRLGEQILNFSGPDTLQAMIDIMEGMGYG